MGKWFGSVSLRKMVEQGGAIEEIRARLDQGELRSDIDQTITVLDKPDAALEKCSLLWLAAMAHRWDVTEDLVSRGAKQDLPIAAVRAAAVGRADFLKFAASKSEASLWSMGSRGTYSGMVDYPSDPIPMHPQQAALWGGHDEALIVLVDDEQRRLDAKGQGSQRAWESLAGYPSALFGAASEALGGVALAKARPLMDQLELRRARMEASVSMLRERDHALNPAMAAAEPAEAAKPAAELAPKASLGASDGAERPKRVEGVGGSLAKLADRRDRARSALSPLAKKNGPG